MITKKIWQYVCVFRSGSMLEIDAEVVDAVGGAEEFFARLGEVVRYWRVGAGDEEAIERAKIMAGYLRWVNRKKSRSIRLLGNDGMEGQEKENENNRDYANN